MLLIIFKSSFESIQNGITECIKKIPCLYNCFCDFLTIRTSRLLGQRVEKDIVCLGKFRKIFNSRFQVYAEHRCGRCDMKIIIRCLFLFGMMVAGVWGKKCGFRESRRKM